MRLFVGFVMQGHIYFGLIVEWVTSISFKFYSVWRVRLYCVQRLCMEFKLATDMQQRWQNKRYWIECGDLFHDNAEV